MTNKFYILDCLADGNDFGECETQILQYFQMIEIKVSASEIRKLLSEMLKEGLICVNNTWTNEHNETPYKITPKGKEIWMKKEQGYV